MWTYDNQISKLRTDIEILQNKQVVFDFEPRNPTTNSIWLDPNNQTAKFFDGRNWFTTSWWNLLDFTITSTITSTDYRTITWSAWVINIWTSTWKVQYSINSGSFVMTDQTYFYWQDDIPWAIQTTLDPWIAVINWWIIIAISKPNTDTTTLAWIKILWNTGDLITADNIVANSITWNMIQANTITASKLSVTTLSAITADMWSITAWNIILDNSWFIRWWQTDFDTWTWFYLWYDNTAYKFSIWNSSWNKLIWDWTTLNVSWKLITWSWSSLDWQYIIADTITANQISANTITTSELNFTPVQPWTWDNTVNSSWYMTTITANSITSWTITWRTLQTSTSGQRVIIDWTSNKIEFYKTDWNSVWYLQGTTFTNSVWTYDVIRAMSANFAAQNAIIAWTWFVSWTTASLLASIYPLSDNTYSLWATNYKWNYIYVNKVKITTSWRLQIPVWNNLY